MPDAAHQPDSEHEGLDEPDLLVSDAIGRLMEFWGFKRNMGRIWAVLYLSGEPLTAQQLRSRLRLSAGAVSMTLKELQRWGAVRKVWIQGARRDHYAAEGNPWKMISRVLAERERAEIEEALWALRRALRLLESGGPEQAARAERVRRLVELAALGRELLEALLRRGRVDVRRLMRSLRSS